jgi:hypothetical protein
LSERFPGDEINLLFPGKSLRQPLVIAFRIVV